VFHSLIALDLTHLFFDFSAFLIPLFLLFLPFEFLEQADAQLDEVRKRFSIPSTLAMVVLPLALLGLLWTTTDSTSTPVSAGRAVTWFAFDLLALMTGLRFIKKSTVAMPAGMLRLRHAAWAAIIPAIVFFNGLTPYLEIKTGYGWNMYSNLVTANGTTNHAVVRATAHLTHDQDDPIRIVSSADGNVQAYADAGMLITKLQLRVYLSEHPQTALTYEQDGNVHALTHASEDPTLVAAPSPLEIRFFSFRAIDPTPPNRCQPSFLPLT
jgi:hypothetical protein